jgi:glycosyltransferase involved in cell wall biosynthesis
MRVTILTQYYPPEIGAPQARLSELASALVRRGHEVTVLTAMPSYPLGKIYPGYGGILSRERRDGALVIRTPIFPTQRAAFLGRLANYFSFACSAGILGTFLLRRCEYLIVESPPLFLGFTGLWLSWRTRAAMVFNVSDLWPESAVRLGVVRAGSLAHRVAAWLERLCYRHAAVVSGQTKTIVASVAERFPGCRTYHFSNGVNTRVFHPERTTAAARVTLGAHAPDACVVLYAGLHGLAQGLDQVLDAAETLGTNAKLRLVLVGDGPAKEKLMQHARERGLSNVRFLDPLPSDQVPPLVAAADILIVPLATHIPGATPSKLYEAMASGRPVVLVAEGEPAAFVREHRVGIAVAPGDARGLVEALRSLSDNAGLRQELGANGRRTAERLFDKVDIDNAFIEYLEHNQRAVPASSRVPRPVPSGRA